MTTLSFEKEIKHSLASSLEKVSDALKAVGFGVLTRIDFDEKIKEKLGHTLPRTVILGACNPSFAYSAYQKNEDLLLLVPCNVVLKEIDAGSTRVSIVKPTALVSLMNKPELVALASEVDQTLRTVIEAL